MIARAVQDGQIVLVLGVFTVLAGVVWAVQLGRAAARARRARRMLAAVPASPAEVERARQVVDGFPALDPAGARAALGWTQLALLSLELLAAAVVLDRALRQAEACGCALCTEHRGGGWRR